MDFRFVILGQTGGPFEPLWDSGDDGVIQAEEILLDENGEPLYVAATPGNVARAWLDAIFPRLPPNEVIAVTAHVVDSTGTPVPGADVDLVLAGASATYSGPATSDVTGSASFTVTPTEEGMLIIRALSDSVSSLPVIVEIAEGDDAIGRLVSAAAAEKRRRARQPAPTAEMSYLDVGPIAAQPAPNTLSTPIPMQPMQPQPRPGMDVLAQQLQRVVMDQEAKLQAEAQAFRKNLA